MSVSRARRAHHATCGASLRPTQRLRARRQVSPAKQPRHAHATARRARVREPERFASSCSRPSEWLAHPEADSLQPNSRATRMHRHAAPARTTPNASQALACVQVRGRHRVGRPLIKGLNRATRMQRHAAPARTTPNVSQALACVQVRGRQREGRPLIKSLSRATRKLRHAAPARTTPNASQALACVQVSGPLTRRQALIKGMSRATRKRRHAAQG